MLDIQDIHQLVYRGFVAVSNVSITHLHDLVVCYRIDIRICRCLSFSDALVTKHPGVLADITTSTPPALTEID